MIEVRAKYFLLTIGLVYGLASFAFMSAASPSVQNIVWVNQVNCTVTGNSLQKSAGCDGCGDAGAASQQTITSGDGYVEFAAAATNKTLFLGLSNGSTGTGYTEIDFAIKLNAGGSAEVRENNVYRADTTYNAADLFRISVESGVVKYYKNAALIHTSTVAPTFPLLVDTSLLSSSSTISDAVLSSSGGSSLPGLANDGSRYTPLNYTSGFTLPAKGGTFVDSRFGTTVKRVSNGQADFGASGLAAHDLHSTNATNWKEDRLLLFRNGGMGYVTDLSGNTVVNDTTLAINNNYEPKWAANANEIYYTELSSNVLKKYNVDTGVRSTVYTFTGYTDINMGEGEGDFSWDGDHLVISAGTAQGIEDVFLFKISTLEIGPVLKTAEIPTAQISAIAGNTITLTNYQNGYSWASYQTSGGRSKMKIFQAGSPNTIRGYAQITSKPATNQLTAGGGLPAGTAVGDKVGLVKSFDQCHVTPDNRVLVGYYQPNSSGNSTYDATGTQLYTKAMTRVALSPAIQVLYHCDVGRLPNGNEVHLQEADSDFTPSTASGGGVQMYNLNTQVESALLDMPYFSTKYPSIASTGVFPWIIVGSIDNKFSDATNPLNTGRTATLPGGSGLASDWDAHNSFRWRDENWNEISLINVETGEIRHLAHHRSRLDTGLYWGVVGAGISQRGTWCFFRTNFALQPTFDFTDVCVIQLRALNTDWTAPAISSVSSGTPGDSSATITWSTDEGATSQVEWGTTTFYSGGISAFSSANVTSHSVNLTGLSSSTTYHYRVKSRDAAGNVALSPDQTFTTTGSETVLMADDFNGASLDTSKWSISVLSGTQDTSVGVSQTGGTLQIGPLKQNTSGPHYNGILSAGAFDFTNAYAYVRAVTAPASNTTADMMFTIPVDGSNHYRIYVEAGVLYFEKKLADTKTSLGSITFDAANHAFWRIRHNSITDQIIFETAPNNGGLPGSWTTRVTVSRELTITSVKMELKAGTWQAEVNAPGTVSFDNFKAAKP